MNLTLKKSAQTILYLNRQQITACSTDLTAPVTLDLPTRVVTDIEIVDIEAFNSLFSDWLFQNKIPAGNIVIVLSPSVYYQKDGSLTDDTVQKTAQLDSFIQTVPFKNIFSKDYFIGNKLKFLAINKDFYEPIIRILEKNSYNVSALLPSFVLENFQLTLTEFSPKEIANIFNRQKILFPFSLISAQEIDKSLNSVVHRQPEDKARTRILVIVFILLWVILLAYIFVYPRFVSRKYTSTPASTYVPKPTSSVSEITPTAAPSISYLAVENIRLKIVNASGIPGQANQIKQALLKNNFKLISTENSSASGQKNIISYSADVSPDTIAQLKNILDPQFGSFIDRETSGQTDADVIITKITP